MCNGTGLVTMLYVCVVMAITHKGYYRNTELVPGPRFHSPELQLTNTIAERERNKSQKNSVAQLGID